VAGLRRRGRTSHLEQTHFQVERRLRCPVGDALTQRILEALVANVATPTPCKGLIIDWSRKRRGVETLLSYCALVYRLENDMITVLKAGARFSVLPVIAQFCL
jgi:phosphopantetheine adenylyltransferase